MDERHWWIAGKIQESFKLGNVGNPAFLESFMCKENILSKVNSFLKGGGPCRLFFYSTKSVATDITPKEIHCTGNLATLKDIGLENVTVLYFLRNKTDKDVDPSKMERDIYCGELKHNTIGTLSSLLVDIYLPLIKAQKDWGQCNEEGQTNLMLSMDKFVTALNETSASVSRSRQTVLRQPENVVEQDFKMQRIAALDSQLIIEYEELVSEWINTIETILNDATDERILDPNADPLSELEKWKRRQRLLTNVTEQLKGKECKVVLAVLITAKSKQLKKWKVIDASITDGLNDTKDKVKYMESLKRHFDQMYQNTSPANIISNVLPGLMNSMKQMDSVSRFYARNGFLGVLLTKVTNQLVQICKDHIKQYTCNVLEDRDELWDKITEEVTESSIVYQGDPQHKTFNKMVVNKLRESRTKMRNSGDVQDTNDSLCARLRMCLSLQTFYRESLRSLREILLKSQNQSRLSSVSSFSAMNFPFKKDSIVSGTKPPHSKRVANTSNCGVPLADEDAILTHLDTFCSRIRQTLEVIKTISQFNRLSNNLIDIPRPRKEDLDVEKSTEEHRHRKSKGPLLEVLHEETEKNSFSTTAFHMTGPHDTTLSAIDEDEEHMQNDLADNIKAELFFHVQNNSTFNSLDVLSEEDVSILKHFYHEDVDGPSVSAIVNQHLARINDTLKDYLTTRAVLDVESKVKDAFDSGYHKFQDTVKDLEKFLRAYLNAVFLRKMTTQQGLDIITKFSPVANRSSVKGIIADKFVHVFEWYESDLKDVQTIYEKHKDHPLVVRNAPPVAGAINWSRLLLKRIEDPMKIFQENKTVTSLVDFGNQVRIYNRLATALVTFESLWFTQWKRNIEEVRSKLRSTLFVLHPETGEIVVNSDNRILELIQEVKWMSRLGIQIPKSALAVLEQEQKFKSYKSHLELVLKDFRKVCKSIPRPLVKMFNPHIDHVHQQFQPGLSSLTWNSMNIDVFLHQIHSATEKLGNMIDIVNHVMDVYVHAVITKIKEFCLFDTEMAFSQTWSVSEFHSEMMKSITERSTILRNYVSAAFGGLHKVAELLATQNPDYKQHMKEKKLKQMLNDEQETGGQETGVETAVSELIDHFKKSISEAVVSATTKSLACLASACGCTGEVIRTFSPSSSQDMGSNSNSPSPRPSSADHQSTSSRNSSAHSKGKHSPMPDWPDNNITNLLDAANLSEKSLIQGTFLQFELTVKFSIPNVIVEPTLDVIQKVITDTADAILEASKDISWIEMTNDDSLFDLISSDSNVQELHSQLTTVVDDLADTVDRHLFHFSYYNFLWKDDMHGNIHEFVVADPGEVAIKREVEHYLHLEKKIMEIPSRSPVGPVNLFTDPVKDSLLGFSMTWKTKFASVLHEEAKKRLDSAVAYRSSVQSTLEQHVQTLDQLNSALHLLEELRDMENKIDGVYQPIEAMFAKLREFELRLPRNEVEEVAGLREKWVELMELAECVREELLKERRGAFEQELDKQIKTFVVEVIQFRNAFDAQGPAVPGIQPAEAVTRLYDFQYMFSVYEAKCKTLNSVSKLFGIPCKPFPELDKTGEELELLSQLYGLFQKFIHFDSRFRDTLWAYIDLECATQEVEGFWDECLALPSKLKDWDAFNDLKNRLQTYLEVFPLLRKLSSKEIRNRHWLQVMQVSHSSFQLEANIFRLSNLLDIGLIQYKAEVEEICKGASRELELEVKMRVTEEEWTEQVLNFEHYKKRGPMFLDKTFTERLLEQLDDAEALLATMLTSRYIGPLKDEAASWAEKLKEVAEVLDLWLEVQALWQYLEAVFSNPLAVKELPQEAKRFSRIDKGWTKMMKRAFDTRNVLQCCYGDEVPKAVVLHHIQEELEFCFKSLVGYLDQKRKAFPRFYFLSDPILLALLSRPNDIESVKPYLRSIFTAIADIKLERTNSSCGSNSEAHGAAFKHGIKHGSEIASLHSNHQGSSSSTLSVPSRVTTPPKIDKRLHQHYSTTPSGLQDDSTMLPSEGLVNDMIVMDATAVLSEDGEILKLTQKVTLAENVEVWLEALRHSVGETLHLLTEAVISDCHNGLALEDWALKYPSQVCRTGMLYHWTAECEAAISEIKNEKKSLQVALRKYNIATSRLVVVLLRGVWKSSDEPVLPLHQLRLEAMINQSIFLKDILENMCQRKLRETTDFEWRRSVRCYLQPVQHWPTSASTNKGYTAISDDGDNVATEAEVKQVPCIWILDSQYGYGTEFHGTDAGIPISPVTEKCFLSMTLALKQMMGTLLAGPPGSCKTETVKGLANILGNFVGIFQVFKEQDPVSIGNIMQGISMDGCWGCFDNVQILNKNGLSVLMEYTQSIFKALKARQSYMSLVDGTEISLCSTVGLFVCANMPDIPANRLPCDITQSFRTVALIAPDVGFILKAKCSSMGWRAPSVLANRLKLLVELVKDQLPPEIHHHFTAQALIGALRRAVQRRNKLKEGKMADKGNMKDEASRSDSQSSETPTNKIRQPTLSVITNKTSQTGMLYKPGTPITLTAQGKQDHSLVCEAVDEIISPRLTSENYALFKSILKNCFSNLPKPKIHTRKSSEKERTKSSGNAASSKTLGKETDFEHALVNKALESKLIPHKPWITKCVQLYTLSQVYSGIIIAGPPGSGKSLCIQTVVNTLSGLTSAVSQTSHAKKVSTEDMHRLLRINPMVVDDTALIFGSIGHKHEWVDGIFTHAVRKANRNRSTTWLSLDGVLNPSWTDNFNNILSGEKVLHLKNGDKLFLSERVKLLFETDDLTQASPSAVSSCGILYIDRDVVGWKPITRSWLDTRPQTEAHVLQKAFQKTLDPVINFVLNNTKCHIKLPEVGMLKTCLDLLAAMLTENIEVSGDLHIERLYLFCLIWTFGGHLDNSDRRAFGDLLKTLPTALPDDDSDICVFDYYVDESGEWDPWMARVPEVIYADTQDILGDVFVDTVDTVRTRILMELSAASGRNVLLAGPHGAGKTALLNDFLNKQDSQLYVCKLLVFSGTSSALQLQQFIDSNIHHRQGFVYGAMENKKLKIFIDDVNLPLPDENGIQTCNEFLRQLLDEKQFCTLHKPFEWHTVEDLSVLSAMTVSDYPAAVNRLLNGRLMRHFSVFWLPAPQDDASRRIVNGILEVNMRSGGAPGLSLDLHKAVVSVSCDMLKAIQNVLRPSPTPGRHHYLFTLKDITNCFQCLKNLAHESRANDIMVISLWRHELIRTWRDRITQTSDLNWFDEKLGGIIEGMWPNMMPDLHNHFVTFPVDAFAFQRPVTSLEPKQSKVFLQAVKSMEELHRCLNTHLTHYNEVLISMSPSIMLSDHIMSHIVHVSLQAVKSMKELHSCLNTHLTHYSEVFGIMSPSIMLSDHIISHIVRLHRILSFHHGGNLLLVGPLGSHLSNLCRLALYTTDIPIHKVDTSKQSSFFDGLRSAIRLSGSEDKVISLLLTSKDLHDPSYLDAINSLLICGEHPPLFSNDEIDGLLQAILPTMKRELPGVSVDPMKFFVSRVKCNLHFVICLQSSHDLLKTAKDNFPGILTGCQIDWMCDWPQEALMSEASYFVAKHQLSEEFGCLSENIATCLANIHSFVLRECNQLPWAGDVSAEINMTSHTPQEEKKDQLKVESTMVPNLPYSKVILLDRIRLNHTNVNNKARNEIYVGPTSYRRFVETFRHLYLQKMKERTTSLEQVKTLATLDRTKADGRIMKKSIMTTTAQFEEAQRKTAELLNKLTVKVTTLEKLKAKVGISKSLDAYLHLNEMNVEDDEDDDLLKEEDYDEYDAEFDRMREANMKTRGVQAKEELIDVQAQVEACKTSLTYARQQVMHWKSKVDRNVVERIRAFQNPPVLVGQVVEMVLVLIGKRLPSQRIGTAKEIHSGKEDLSSPLSTSSGSSRLLIKKAKIKDASDRFDKTQWKTMQQTMTDSVKFVDMLLNISWDDGLPTEVLSAVESYLACSKDGQLGVTGEGSLLENAEDKHFQAVKQRSPSPGARGGLTIAGVKYASEDCATLVHYTIAIVEYSRLCGPLQAAIERMHELEREIDKNEELQNQQEQELDIVTESKQDKEEKDLDLSEADLPGIQQEIAELQSQFDQVVVEKHSLEVELQSMNDGLKAAKEMADRCRMGEFFMQLCEHHGLPLHKKQLFRNLELADFLYTPLDIIKLQQLQLPTTSLMLQNFSFLMHDASLFAWPLVCDPTSHFIDWLRCLHADKELVIVKHHEVRSQLDSCLSEGTPLLVTDCDVNSLVKDQRFTSTIQNCSNFIHGKAKFKVIVADHEVECDPGFRLFLHTTTEPHMCPHELAVLTSVIFFQQSRAGVEEELLDIFMAQEKSRLNNEQTALRKEKQENLETLEKLEDQMRAQLSSDVRLMNDLQATKRVIELQQHYDETLETLTHIETSENSILKARDSFRAIAQQAAVCFDTAQYMRYLNPLYQVSFKQFTSIYKTAIAHSERSSVKAVIDRLTYSAFLTSARGLLHKDRFLYALLLAIEVDNSLGNVGLGEREFIISPGLSATVMSAITASQSLDSSVTQSKKPFDWMTDDQFHNLQILATHFDWFKNIFDRMTKDGRETLWRNLCESEFPENVALPDKMDDSLNAIQRLCILRAVRSDRLLEASSNFISQVLGKKYLTDIPPDLPMVSKQSTPSLPILLLFDTAVDLPVKIFQDFSIKKQINHLTILLTDNHATEEKAVKRQILKGMAEGSWVLLDNAHNSPHLLNSVESIFQEGLQQCDSSFRLWISSHVRSPVPVHLLQNSVKVVLDSPQVMRDSLVRSFTLMDTDILKQSNRSEWPVLLHNLCYLHAAIQLRTRFGSGGWNLPFDFASVGYRELQEAISFSLGEFKDPLFAMGADGSVIPRTTSWAGIRYMLSEIVYGTYVTDMYDQHSLSAMIEFWCGSIALKKDFEVARLKYRTPVAFFNPNVRLSTLTQAFDGLTERCLETPEACHLHPSTETVLEDDQYVLTRLNKVFDVMPCSSSVSSQLLPQQVTSLSGDPGVSSASCTTYKMNRDVELWETCHTLLQKIPKTYSKDYIAEKVKKVGGPTAFNNFILKELEIMYRLLHEIKTNLQLIKAATDSTALGDDTSHDILDVAADIYQLRVPQVWRHMSGNSAPPATFGIGQWLVELQNRCHHFERILTLGREKMPAYWLGAFFNPRGLLALLKQDSVRNYASDRPGSLEPFTFQTELTTRDKDHLRDPPQDGMFVWGIYIWGCAWERTTGEIQDLPPRTSFTPLPVVHVTCWPLSEKPSWQDNTRASETYQCPVYHSRQARQEVVLEVDVRKEGIPATRWALRGLSATIRPY